MIMKITIDTNDYKEESSKKDSKKSKREYKKSGKYSKKNIGFDFGRIGKRMRGKKRQQ